jgi:guanylate kinase
LVLEIDWQGAAQVRQLLPQAISIFVLPPSIEALEQRLRGRGQDSDEVIKRRLSAAREEMSHVGEFDYVTINDKFESAFEDIRAIVRSQRLLRGKQLARNAQLIEALL